MKHRANYSVDNLAAILAKLDPNGIGRNPESLSFKHLILEDIRRKKLVFIPTFYTTYGSRKAEREVNDDTEIPRNQALAWAKEKEFDISHVS